MSDYKFWDVFRDPLWLLHNFHRKYKQIKPDLCAAWSSSLVNGAVTFRPLHVDVNTSVTASSRGMAYTFTVGFNSGNLFSDFIDWTKRLEVSFIFLRENSDVEAVARIQLKEASTQGVLADKGIGIQISNYTMVGEAYGTARQTTGTLKTLTDRQITRVKIVKTDTSVDFWVDGVLAGSLTGTAVPITAGVNSGCIVISIVNGVTGGVDVSLVVGNIEVVQEW